MVHTSKIQKRFKSSRCKNNTWEMEEAKANFSQLVDDASKKGYQTITKKGEPIAVILSIKEFDKLAQPKESFLDFFKNSPYPEIELDIQRSKELPRIRNFYPASGCFPTA